MSITLQGKVKLRTDSSINNNSIDSAVVVNTNLNSNSEIGVESTNINTTELNGTWRFSKDKKSSLNYSYKLTDNSVPRDLLDYVSFHNEVSAKAIGTPSSNRKSSASKKGSSSKGRSRNRPPVGAALASKKRAEAAAAAVMAGATSVVAEIDNNSSSLIEITNDNNSSETPNEVKLVDSNDMVPVSTDQLEPAVTPGDVDISIRDNGDNESSMDIYNDSGTVPIDTSTERALDVSNISNDSNVDFTLDIKDNTDTSDVAIEQSHPLLGLWKGHFNVANIQGGEEQVEETFFFYQIQGTEKLEQWASLPPEPIFPYSLIQQLQQQQVYPLPTPQEPGQSSSSVESTLLAEPNSSVTIAPLAAAETESSTSNDQTLDIKQSKKSEESSTTAPIDLSEDNDRKVEGIKQTESTAFAEPSADISVPAVENQPSQEREVDSKPEIDISGQSGGNTDIKTETDNNVSGSTAWINAEQEIDPNKAALAMFCSLNKTEPADYDILVGFGRNPFGRFSLAALYHKPTGEVFCEKKYMQSKYASKRGRRSYVECAAAAVAAAGGSIPLQLQSIIAPPAPPLLRQRSNTSNLRGGSRLSGTDGKRKRVSSDGQQKKSKLPYDRTDDRRLSSQQARDRAESKVKHNIANAKINALYGDRNPDLDDPAVPYREAFQDCDSGEIYEGGWSFGVRHGKGICLYSDGLMYEGNWVLGKEQGQGTLMTGDRKVVYSGEWVDGMMHGFGTYYFGNGDRYVGDWREGTRHGRGDYYWALSGCRYSGEFRDNKRMGKGTFIWPDNSAYVGDWENDKRHGRGMLQLSSGFWFDGSWSRNVIEGKGICRFPSGQEYEGTYKNGLRDGRGTVRFAEGAVYEGRFKEDRLDGQGTLKVLKPVPGTEPDELMIPIQIQSDFLRIHLKAGFGNDSH